MVVLMRTNQVTISHVGPRQRRDARSPSDLPRCVFVVVQDDESPGEIEALRACLPESIEVVPIEPSRIGENLTDTDPTGVWRAQLDSLSKREHEVLQELIDGYTFVEAAARLYVSRHTFRTHMKNILAKLGVHSSLEAVSVGVRAGLRPRVEEIVLD